jgi:hypothetical protein
MGRDDDMATDEQNATDSTHTSHWIGLVHSQNIPVPWAKSSYRNSVLQRPTVVVVVVVSSCVDNTEKDDGRWYAVGPNERATFYIYIYIYISLLGWTKVQSGGLLLLLLLLLLIGVVVVVVAFDDYYLEKMIFVRQPMWVGRGPDVCNRMVTNSQ